MSLFLNTVAVEMPKARAMAVWLIQPWSAKGKALEESAASK
jgi:hypothetical protein